MQYTFEKLEMYHKKEVTNILNYYIQNSTSVYREETVDENFTAHFIEGQEIYCSYIIKDSNDETVGFCTLEAFKSIPSFAHVAEVMYFLHPVHTAKGAGTHTLQKLINEAKNKGISTIVVDISAENSKSIDFHIRHGFSEYGRLKNAGKKFNRYFDIVYMSKEI